MVAIASPTHHRRTPPHLRLVVPGRRPRYALRRTVALVLAVLALSLVALVADAALGALSATPAGTATPVDAAGAGPAEIVVVQPGDTLWSIASDVAPGDDPRAVVDQLVELNGSSAIEAGQRLELP